MKKRKQKFCIVELYNGQVAVFRVTRSRLVHPTFNGQHTRVRVYTAKSVSSDSATQYVTNTPIAYCKCVDNARSLEAYKRKYIHMFL